jgi:membrane-associated phospholipid phosphatase
MRGRRRCPSPRRSHRLRHRHALRWRRPRTALREPIRGDAGSGVLVSIGRGCYGRIYPERAASAVVGMHNRYPRSYTARALLAGILSASTATTVPAFAQAGGVAAADPSPPGVPPAAPTSPPPVAPILSPPETIPPSPKTTPPKTKAKEEVEKNPVKTEQATEKAALTPIVPSPSNPFKPAFQLYAEIDIPVLAIGTVFAAARLIPRQKAYCAPLCDKSEVNGIDRVTAGRYDTHWSLASDVGLYVTAGGAGLLLLFDEGLGPALNDSVVVAQSAMLATGITSSVTLAAGRPRPFLYGENAPADVRNSSSAGLSFLSSHTAVTFAIATSSWMAMRRLEPNNSASTWTLAVGLSLASFVGVARVMGGQHFITDAVGGAVVGASTGVVVPALHSTPVKVVPQLSPDTKAIAVVGRF